jgi:hypothetical protein
LRGCHDWSFEVAAELVGLLEVLPDQVRGGGCGGLEVDVLDIGDAQEAEGPVVGDRCLCREAHPPRWELSSAGVAILWFRRHRVGFLPEVLPATA